MSTPQRRNWRAMMSGARRRSVVLASALTIAAAALAMASTHRSFHSAASTISDELTIPVGKGPGAVVLADVNHDGHLDILVANVESETLTVLLGDGKGHFVAAPGAPIATGKAPNDIAVGDFNA